MTVSQKGPVSRAPGSQGFPLDVLETKTLMWGGSTRIMEAEGTCMISARRFTISCHFRMISEGTSIECATLELRSCGSEAAPFSVNTPVHAEQFLGLEVRAA